MPSTPIRAARSLSRAVTGLRNSLARLLEEAVRDETAGLPREWADRLWNTLPFQQMCSLSLLSCASAQWCGAPASEGLSSAASVLLLAGATAAHAVPSVGVVLPCLEEYDGGGPPEAGRVLAGDAMLPLAVKILCRGDAPVSLHLTGLLMNSAAGILEAMSFGSHSLMTGSWNGRLASLAARMGTVSAGASPAYGETASLAGLALGRAAATLHLSSSRDSLVEAQLMIRDALEPIGREGRLFHQIAEDISARGAGGPDDLFAGLERV